MKSKLAATFFMAPIPI